MSLNFEFQNTSIDDPYNIVAKVTGNPELTWYKDGVPITQDSRLKAKKVSVHMITTICYNFAKLFGLIMDLQSCEKTVLLGFENHSQNVPLPTPKCHYGTICQPVIPEM